MKAVLDDTVLAESDDIVAAAGYDYFPPSAVRIDLLEKAAMVPRPRARPSREGRLRSFDEEEDNGT